MAPVIAIDLPQLGIGLRVVDVNLRIGPGEPGERLLDGPKGTTTYPLKLQALGKLIFYRHIAHVTQKVEKLCF